MSDWATGGVIVVVLGVLVGSPVVVFIGGAILLIRVLADLWPRRVLARLEYRRDVSPDRTVVGDEVEARISLWNRARMPVAWATAEDSVADGLRTEGASSLNLAGPLRPYERITRRFRLVPTRRGVHEVGPVTLGVAELFGTHSAKRAGDVEPNLVIARPLMAPVIGRLPTRAPLAQQRVRRSLFTDPTLFAGVRPFGPGDPLRSIHWRASARQPSLQTKRYEPSLSGQQVLVLDVQTVEGPYWALVYDEALFEELCVAAVSIARTSITSETPCGFAAAGYTRSMQRLVFLPARADRSQLGRIADALARLTTESSAPLTALLAWLPRRVARGTSLVVLTGRNPRGTTAVARRLRESGFPVHFVLLGGAERRAEEARRLGLSAWSARVDMERGRPRSVVLQT